MGRAPCCEKMGLRRGRWTAEEDAILSNYIHVHGEGCWRSLPKNAGLLRCGKSCRLRWINYLRSDLKRGNISGEEEDLIIKLHATLGNRWSLIAGHLAGRTDNEIKNYWNSHLSRKITPSSPKVPTKRHSSAMKAKKPRKKPSIVPLMPEKQSNMINPSAGGGGGELVMHDSSASEEKENEIDDCFYDESLLIDPITGVLPSTDDQEDVINNMNSSSSSTNGSNQVNEVHWDWEWDFEVAESMEGLGLGGEEEDDIMSWPWESEEEQVGVDVQKQDAMIAWLLS